MESNIKTWKQTLLYVGLFSLAMGYLESAVVVYMREIYYPEGFSFPLKAMSKEIAITELFREAATIIMLISIGLMAAKKPIIRFALFIYSFAIWDICYYIFLYLLIGWPATLFEWDLLFLIPVAWIGPVIAPVINSLTMIILALSIIKVEYRTGKPELKSLEWSLLIIGSVITIVGYTIDYTHFMINSAPADDFFLTVLNYVPTHFNWWLFVLGEILFFYTLLNYWRRIVNRQS